MEGMSHFVTEYITPMWWAFIIAVVFESLAQEHLAYKRYSCSALFAGLVTSSAIVGALITWRQEPSITLTLSVWCVLFVVTVVTFAKSVNKLCRK